MSRASRLPLTGSPQPIPLNRVVQTAMWQCLIDVYRSLGASIALIDHRFSVVPVASKGVAASAPAGLDDLDYDEETKEQLSHAFADQAAVMLSSGNRATSCTPVVQSGATVGAVLVTAEQPQLDEAQLLRAGAVLARAIEDELIESHADVALLSRRVAALHQLLHTAADRGTAHDVVQQFSEALSIWEEAEVFGYRTDLNGRHQLDVALPGSDRSTVPEVIEAGRVPPEPPVLLMSRGDKEDLGFRFAGETMLTTAVTDGGSWLLAINADAHAPERFELYLAALRVAVPVALARESARLTWAMMQHFVEATRPEEGASRALAALTAASGAGVRFSVRNPASRVVLAVGGSIEEDEREPVRNASRLRARFGTSSNLTAILEMRAAGTHGFGTRESVLFDAAVDNVRTWLTTAGPQMTSHTDRRRSPRSFDQVIERYARDPDSARDAAVILISAADPTTPPQTAYEWIRHVRPQLRPTDLAGRLASGEVAILALDTSPAGARVVAQRIAQILSTTGQADRPIIRTGAATAVGRWTDGDAVVDRTRLQPVDSSPAIG